MDVVDGGEIDVPVLLPRRAHCCELRRQIALDDAIGMRDRSGGAFARRDVNHLLRDTGALPIAG